MKPLGWMLLVISCAAFAIGVYQFQTADQLSNNQAIEINQASTKAYVDEWKYGGRTGKSVDDDLTAKAFAENKSTASLVMCCSGAGIVIAGILLIVAGLQRANQPAASSVRTETPDLPTA